MNQLKVKEKTPGQDVSPIPTSITPSIAKSVPEVKKLTPEMIEALKKPLPPEAVSPHPTKTYLSTIKAIYVVERLNEVFGIGSWRQWNEVINSEGKMKVVHSYLEIPEYGIYLDNFGGNDNADEGDALKGAATDALTKMASYLYIGMDVYKGKAEKQPINDYHNSRPQSTEPGKMRMSEKQMNFIAKLCKEKNISKEELKETIERMNLKTASEVIDYLLGVPANPQQELPVVEEGEIDASKIPF